MNNLSWTVLAIALIAALAACSNYLNMPAMSDDPMPWAHDGLGCITDSECESVDPASGVERLDDNFYLTIREGE